MLKKLFLPLFALTLLGGAFLASNPIFAEEDPCKSAAGTPGESSCRSGTNYKRWQFNENKCGSFSVSELQNCSSSNTACTVCKRLKDSGYDGPNNEWAKSNNIERIVNQCKKEFENLSTTNPGLYSAYTSQYAEGGKSQWLQTCYKEKGLSEDESKGAIIEYGLRTQPIIPSNTSQDPPDGGSNTEKQEQTVYDEWSNKSGYSVPNTAPSVESGCRTFLGMVSWDCHTDFQDVSDEEDISRVVVMIAINIFTDITVLASYLVIGYIIYGGYLYIFANGDVGKVSTGKKALNQAFIGLAITLSAHIIVNAIRVAFMHNTGSFEACATTACVDSADSLVSGFIQWVVGIGGAVAAVFVVGGGIMYMTSAGDPNKLQLAKNVIKYALIGLVIVALAEIITGFMTNAIVNAKNSSGSGEETSYINNIKEYYENQKVS